MYDILIKNGKIVDGTGTPWELGDVAIKNGVIKEIGLSLNYPSSQVINAKDKIISPGFIDIHSHSEFAVLIDPKVESKIVQGVTTDVSGNCGNTPAPLLNSEAINWAEGRLEGSDIDVNWKDFGGYLDFIKKQRIAFNFASYVGHHQIRMSVMGFEDRKPSNDEMNKMKKLVTDCIKEGAIGLSTGLDETLVPGSFAETEEIIELCKTAKQTNPNSVYTSHIRNRQENVLEAVEEFIKIVKESGIKGQLSHITPRYPDGEKVEKILKLIEEAREKGADILCDVVCPTGEEYHTGWGILYTQVMPEWALNKGISKALEYLDDEKMKKKMKQTHQPLWGVVREGRWETLYLTHTKARKDLTGKNFEEISRIMNKKPWDAAFDILLDEGKDFKEVRVISTMHTEEKATRMALQSPLVMIESDRAASATYPPLSNYEHKPNSFDTFPRYIQRYVKDDSELSLEEGIKKITALPAKRLGLRDRGIISEGKAADIVVFDLENISAMATYKDPAVYPEGIDYVIVNGEFVVKDGEHTGSLPGKVLNC